MRSNKGENKKDLNFLFKKMVWFTFTFLLGIPRDNDGKLEETNLKKGENSQSGTSYAETEVAKPNFSCHIEYVLIPNEPPKFIDVVCWNQAAKIYFEDSTSAIIPLEVEKLRWVHFRVNHNVKLNLEQIPLFRSHNVKFSIRLGNKNFGEPAKSDKPKKFYGPKFTNGKDENSIQKQMFQPLSESPEDLITVSYFKEHLTPQQQLYISLDTTIETSENYNKLFKTIFDLTSEYHDENFERKPTPPFEEIPPLTNIFQRPTEEVVTSKKGKDNKTEKKAPAKIKEVDNMEFSITGEQFLSGRKIFKYCLKYNSEELPYVFYLGTVKNALTKAQATVYNPLSIVISSIDNLPVEELKGSGVTKLKFRFLIFDRLLAESNLIPIEKRIKIDLARTIFTDGIDKQELIYFIQTRGLNIEILGNQDKSQLSLGDLQGGANLERNVKKTNEPGGDFVVLGKVAADISSILFQPHRVFLKCNFQAPNGFGFPSDTDNDELFTSINEFNSCAKKRRKNENERLLACSSESGPVLTISAGIGHPLTSTRLTVTTNPNLFNRLFAVFYDVNLATPIIQLIQDEVDEILGLLDYTKNGKNVERPLTKNHPEGSLESDSDRKTRLTGFLIDCVDRILLYAESSVSGGVQRVWALASCLSPPQARVLYDSSLIFLDRLYKNFFKFGGFLGIALKEPPHVLLSKPQFYSSKCIPQPAQKALRCLSLLADCKSIKAATRNNLFPDFDSLASLAIEFGVPIQISDK